MPPLSGTQVHHEIDRYASVQAPGLLYGFHPADENCSGGLGGATVYWEVDDVDVAVTDLVAR
jgi:hypothetical protein